MLTIQDSLWLRAANHLHELQKESLTSTDRSAGLCAEKQDNNREAGYDMRCALMNLTLPMESLAHQLLL